eukprot:CAMPEP_0172310090 /NCGR_PEP_ID=MMETSP1058-20130122/11290_1 /TAXON_ID=83371 /ORGANISM="Detonula confervacea, Strain CCMP 353" /LENGTH=241 /DNA_ID=CAMNT_0013022853 /DNA_START=62 /DNA_END=787 /DNA_ORIENTATION=+
MEHPSNSPVEYLEECHSRRYIEREDPMEIDATNINLPSTSAMLSIPRPAVCLPARCHSEPIHYNANGNAQVDGLLEDWPRRMSCCSVNAQDWQSLCKKLHPRVTFSESSSMHIYHPDPLYARNKSYTKEDRKSFGTEAMLEAIRIKRLVLSTPGATKDSFKYLLKNNLLSLEEIVGIEHLVLRKSASKMLKERRDHARAVLMAQQKLKMQDHDTTKKLGEFSASKSIKSAKRARIRAAMAA